jgi:SAM-dependent methyltransferase
MLHLFGRNGARDGSPIDRMEGSVAVSHILVKLLKRLRHMEKPHLLDLGRLSGSNIEFFARHGCKVQVEDLLLALEADPAQQSLLEERDTGAVPPPSPAEDGPVDGCLRVASDAGVAPDARPLSSTLNAPRTVASPAAAAGASLSGASTGPHTSTLRPGARPSRRIVLPPRTFASTKLQSRLPEQEARPRPGRPGFASVRNALLPTTFAYPDETFDAIVAWDIFNYYAPGPMTLLAAEARRVLKPGGLLLGYFQARRPEGPETPLRYRILDEGRVACDGQPGPPLQRHVYQNRDIEKMFTGLAIVELYFLKNATRELLMEKKSARSPMARSLVRPATPKPRFTLE